MKLVKLWCLSYGTSVNCVPSSANHGFFLEILVHFVSVHQLLAIFIRQNWNFGHFQLFWSLTFNANQHFLGGKFTKVLVYCNFPQPEITPKFSPLLLKLTLGEHNSIIFGSFSFSLFKWIKATSPPISTLLMKSLFNMKGLKYTCNLDDGSYSWRYEPFHPSYSSMFR